MPFCTDIPGLAQYIQKKCAVDEPRAHQIIFLIFKRKGIDLPKPPMNQIRGAMQEQVEHESTIEKALESSLHRAFTVMADRLYGAGFMTREERIALSSAVGDMLADWRNHAIAKLQKAGVANPEQVLQKAIKTTMEEGGGTMPIDVPFGQDGRRQGMNTLSKAGELEWPYGDDPETRKLSSFPGQGIDGARGGIPQISGEDDATKDRKNDLLRQEAGTGNAAFVFQANNAREERGKEWAHGKRFSDDATGDFDEEDDTQDDNYKRENRNMSSKLNKEKLTEAILAHEFKAFLADSIKQKILGESPTPLGQSKPVKPFGNTVKDVKKSGRNTNPWATAWNKKNKQAKEAPSIEALTEFAEQYMKEMGFNKAAPKEGCNIWKRKKAK